MLTIAQAQAKSTTAIIKFNWELEPYLSKAIQQAARDLGGKIYDSELVEDTVYLSVRFPLIQMAEIFQTRFSLLAQTTVTTQSEN